MNLPKICPNCKSDLQNDFPYYARGIQYWAGTVADIEASPNLGEEPRLELNGELRNSSWINPYQVLCRECSHVLWERHLVVNEEKFFVEKGGE